MSRYTIDALTPANTIFAIEQARKAFRTIRIVSQHEMQVEIEVDDAQEMHNAHFIIFIGLLGSVYYATQLPKGRDPILMVR